MTPGEWAKAQGDGTHFHKPSQCHYAVVDGKVIFTIHERLLVLLKKNRRQDPVER